MTDATATSKNALTELKSRLARISDLRHAAAVLEWDQETYMPSGAAEARARQLATLRGFAHELFTDDETTTLLEKAASQTGADNGEARPGARDGGDDTDFPYAVDLVRVVREDLDRARRIPASLVAELAETSALAKGAWQQARSLDRFDLFSDHLKKLVDLNVRKAEALGFDETPYDALLDEYERGMTTAEVAAVFDELREGLVPLIEQVAAAPQIDDGCLHASYPTDAQWMFGLDVARDFGYDLDHGRQDISAHPFSTSFSSADVRITTRIDERFFNPGFFGTLHEAGHAMYEQGVDPVLARTTLGEGTSLGMHESQSRLWENLVGRSRPFWHRYFPVARRHFPEALSEVPELDFYRAVNKVEPSLIRVEADELTYNLHIMVRFELEQAMIKGDVDIDDLPRAWNDRMESYLGIRPNTDAYGVLQDIHWSLGAIGYFPTYALGNLMSVQLFDAAGRDMPDLNDRIAEGRFDALLDWLRTNIHRAGRTRTASDLLEDATGSTLAARPWLEYAAGKIDELYG